MSKYNDLLTDACNFNTDWSWRDAEILIRDLANAVKELEKAND